MFLATLLIAFRQREKSEMKASWKVFEIKKKDSCLYYREAPREVLCLFNVHYGRWAWAAGEMPTAQRSVIRENVDLVHKLAPCTIRTLSNITFCV